MTKTIILACVGGLTTSMLVERIHEVIYRDKLNYSFYSVGITGVDNLKNVDVLLLSPQLAYLEEKAKANLDIPVAVISDEDFDRAAAKMFDLINFIVKKAITEPKELDELYQLMPENARNAAEDKDKKNLKNQAQNPSSPPTQK